MLRGYKGIADFLEKVWGIKPTAQSVYRWAKSTVDPLPTKRIAVQNAKRAIVSADSNRVEEWARRHTTMI